MARQALEAARHEYEAARAAFYASPTDDGLKTSMLGIDAVLGKLRVERGDSETALAKVKATMDELQVSAHAVARLAAHQTPMRACRHVVRSKQPRSHASPCCMHARTHVRQDAAACTHARMGRSAATASAP